MSRSWSIIRAGFSNWAVCLFLIRHALKCGLRLGTRIDIRETTRNTMSAAGSSPLIPRFGNVLRGRFKQIRFCSGAPAHNKRRPRQAISEYALLPSLSTSDRNSGMLRPCGTWRRTRQRSDSRPPCALAVMTITKVTRHPWRVAKAEQCAVRPGAASCPAGRISGVDLLPGRCESCARSRRPIAAPSAGLLFRRRRILMTQPRDIGQASSPFSSSAAGAATVSSARGISGVMA